MNGYFDFNGADKQQSFELIPAGTIVPLVMVVKPGGIGDGGWLTASKRSDAMMLNCEFTVTDGPYVKRKIFQYMVVSGGSLNEKGESKAGAITRATLRSMLESARNIMPDDMSNAAMDKRRAATWQDFNGLCFVAEVGVEKGTDGYQDKNRIKMVITPNMKEYSPAPQVSTPNPFPAAAQAPASAPAWSQGAATPPPPAASANPAPAWAR